MDFDSILAALGLPGLVIAGRAWTQERVRVDLALARGDAVNEARIADKRLHAASLSDVSREAGKALDANTDMMKDVLKSFSEARRNG